MERTVLRDYAALGPTIMEPEAVHAYLGEILNFAETSHTNDKEVAEALLEMIFRLSDTYSKLDEQTGARILVWVQEHGSSESIEFLDILCSILANLEKKAVVAFVKEKVKLESHPEPRKLLKELSEELSVEFMPVGGMDGGVGSGQRDSYDVRKSG